MTSQLLSHSSRYRCMHSANIFLPSYVKKFKRSLVMSVERLCTIYLEGCKADEQSENKNEFWNPRTSCQKVNRKTPTSLVLNINKHTASDYMR